MCDCYPGCWGDHAKELGWNKIIIPDSLIEKHRDKYCPIVAAVKDIVESEGIPYGDYVSIDNFLYVNPNFVSNTKGVLS